MKKFKVLFSVVGSYGHVLVTAQDITVGFSGKEISMSAAIGFNLEMASPDYKAFNN